MEPLTELEILQIASIFPLVGLGILRAKAVLLISPDTLVALRTALADVLSLQSQLDANIASNDYAMTRADVIEWDPAYKQRGFNLVLQRKLRYLALLLGLLDNPELTQPDKGGSVNIEVQVM